MSTQAPGGNQIAKRYSGNGTGHVSSRQTGARTGTRTRTHSQETMRATYYTGLDTLPELTLLSQPVTRVHEYGWPPSLGENAQLTKPRGVCCHVG